MRAGHVTSDDLERFCVAALESVGASSGAAATVAAALVDADLRGLDSHGVVARLPGYVARCRSGGIVVDAQVERVQDDGGPVAVVDGHDGFGQVVAAAAVEVAQNLAREHGVGLVAARGSNHLGAVGYYTRLMAERGFVGFVVSGGGPRIAPWGGAEPLLATNPWSFAFPVADRAPLVVDVSNGAVLTGSVDDAAARGERIPLDWALDAQGRPTEVAAEGAAGSLLAFGGAKGTALTLALEMLASVVTGGAFSRQVPSIADPTRPQQLGHLFLALEVGRFMPPEEMRARAAQLVDWITGSRPVEGGPPVRAPGDRGAATASERSRAGVPLLGRREPLDELAAELGIEQLPGAGR
jgi:LDH2 family malate/lactate/ureidoglycolate dehydrogenase